MSVKNDPRISPEISVSDIIDFFAERGLKEECPLCNHKGWQIITLDEIEKVHGEEIKEKGTGFYVFVTGIKNLGINAAHLICMNCGFIRSHAIDTVKPHKEHQDDKKGK
jgi:hypothetical protein